jgi:ferredoxin-like protein FixX
MNDVNVDEKLSINKYYVDEEYAHIVIKSGNVDMKEYGKLVLACPAGLYKLDERGGIKFDYAGCLECGACRILCGKSVLEKWDFPRGTFGIEYRWG